MTYFIPIFEIQHDTIPLVGRKSYGIKQLQNIGVPTVDKGIVLTTDFTYTYLQENGITPCSQQQLEERVLNGTFSQELSDVLHEVYTSFSGTPLAVRSSATFEDMEHASFGGQ